MEKWGTNYMPIFNELQQHKRDLQAAV